MDTCWYLKNGCRYWHAVWTRCPRIKTDKFFERGRHFRISNRNTRFGIRNWIGYRERKSLAQITDRYLSTLQNGRWFKFKIAEHWYRTCGYGFSARTSKKQDIPSTIQKKNSSSVSALFTLGNYFFLQMMEWKLNKSIKLGHSFLTYILSTRTLLGTAVQMTIQLLKDVSQSFGILLVGT